MLHYYYSYMYNYKFTMYSCTGNTAKKNAVLLIIDDISKAIENVNDTNALDRVLALLTQVSTSIKAATMPLGTETMQFEKKDHFHPTEKNETQLRFKKTTTNPGRKKQNIPLKCIFICSSRCTDEVE